MPLTHSLHETLVKAEGVSLSFGEKVILKPTSIEVRDIQRPGLNQGQVIGILGPSGCGKTQFSRMLAGLQAPTSGQILVSDFEANPSGSVLKPVAPGVVGMVAQSYPLFAHRTVKGNLLVALEQSGLDKEARETKISEYLHMFQLAAWQDRYPIQLSGGQRQRIAIIQALLCSEHFIVMDEPFTGLDPLMKDVTCELIDKVASLHEKNTIFIVAHDIGALVSISDQLWLFGRDHDAQGNLLPGATIKKRYDLIAEGLAWSPEIRSTPRFHEFADVIKEEFKSL